MNNLLAGPQMLLLALMGLSQKIGDKDVVTYSIKLEDLDAARCSHTLIWNGAFGKIL
jgi:hypothetical protein